MKVDAYQEFVKEYFDAYKALKRQHVEKVEAVAPLEQVMRLGPDVIGEFTLRAIEEHLADTQIRSSVDIQVHPPNITQLYLEHGLLHGNKDLFPGRKASSHSKEASNKIIIPLTHCYPRSPIGTHRYHWVLPMGTHGIIISAYR